MLQFVRFLLLLMRSRWRLLCRRRRLLQTPFVSLWRSEMTLNRLSLQRCKPDITSMSELNTFYGGPQDQT